MPQTHSRYNSLINHQSGKEFNIDELNTFCPDEHEPLVAQYDCSPTLDKSILNGRTHNMWRYKEMLPVMDENNIVSLGEGFTPILPMTKIADLYSFSHLDMKDESGNATGSFKARGLGMAVSKAKELGVKEFCIPTAGNAGSALSAYCAKGDMKAHIYMPRQTPQVFQLDCRIMGANVTLIDGNISDCGVAMREANKDSRWFDVTTLKEPFRLEGKKTMGYEIAEQYNWSLPDVIIYPTGGGTGLIGIWKAFQEMLALGWIDHIPTRMVVVQTDGCDPIVKAFNAGLMASTPYVNPAVTIANGLRVPHAFGHKLILKTLKESDGTAIAVSEEDMIESLIELSRREGMFISPEGAAVWHAAKVLRDANWIKSNDKVLMLNTGSAYKYAENLYDLV